MGIFSKYRDQNSGGASLGCDSKSDPRFNLRLEAYSLTGGSVTLGQMIKDKAKELGSPVPEDLETWGYKY